MGSASQQVSEVSSESGVRHRDIESKTGFHRGATLLCRVLRAGYPEKTIVNVAAACGEPVLTVKKWVDGTAEPSIVLMPVLFEILVREYRVRRAARRKRSV